MQTDSFAVATRRLGVVERAGVEMLDGILANWAFQRVDALTLCSGVVAVSFPYLRSPGSVDLCGSWSRSREMWIFASQLSTQSFPVLGMLVRFGHQSPGPDVRREFTRLCTKGRPNAFPGYDGYERRPWKLCIRCSCSMTRHPCCPVLESCPRAECIPTSSALCIVVMVAIPTCICSAALALSKGTPRFEPSLAWRRRHENCKANRNCGLYFCALSFHLHEFATDPSTSTTEIESETLNPSAL